MSRCVNPQHKVPRGVQSVASMIQLALDWHFHMAQKGHHVATRFDPGFLYTVYHVYHDTHAISRKQLDTLRSIVDGRAGSGGWHMRDWEQEHYPQKRHTAPVPPRPPVTSIGEQLQDIFDWVTHANPDFCADLCAVSTGSTSEPTS
jgi:hypothetical protein